MDPAALDPSLRSPHDSSSISVSVPQAASPESSSSSPPPSGSIPGQDQDQDQDQQGPGPPARGSGSGTGHPGYTHGSVPAAREGGAPSAAHFASAQATAGVPSPELQRVTHGVVHFHSPYPQPPAPAPLPVVHADHHPADHDSAGGDAKKARACEACRNLKVRCEPGAEDPDGACRRCVKAGRNCIITQPTRKRQKKTDSRVAELEKKIDALTATLTATRAGQPATPLPAHPEAATGYHGTPAATASPTNPARSHDPSLYAAHAAMPSASPGALAGQKRKHTQPVQNANGAPATIGSHESPDLVDRGVITINEAAQLLGRYNYQMAPHLPGVVFPPSLTAGELRRTKPVLFLAIMAAASSATPEVQRVAVRELMQTFADRIIITGEKSIELVQALLVAVVWSRPPEEAEEVKFYSFVHMAMVIALDLGLGKPRPRGSKPNPWGAQPPRRHSQPDPTTVEARRTWLLCYYMTVNAAMALHRPFLLRWSSFMAECMDILESSPEAAPTDKFFCHLVWTHRLVEEIGFQFCMDDPSVSVNLSDHMTQHRIRSFERELDKHRMQVPAELMQPTLKFSFHTLSLYMHELALQTDPVDAFRGPFASESASSSAPQTPAYTSALAACLTAVDGIFETFLGMDTESILCLPIFNFVRVSYATVILIKIYSAASNPSSDLGKVIDKDSLKVEQHLWNLVEKYRVVSANHKHHPVSNFLTVAVLVRAWFLNLSQGQPRRKEAKADNTTNGTGPDQADNHSQTSSNPLQLLSEAATNNQAASSSSEAQAAAGELTQNGKDASGGTEWAYSSPKQADSNPKSNGGAQSNMPPPPSPLNQAHPHQHGFISGTPAPWLSFGPDMDPGNLLDGFTQAWDMTMEGLGDGQGGLQDLYNYALGVPDPLLASAATQVPGSNLF